MPQWLIWAVLSSFFAGITAVLLKIGAHDIDGDVATWLRAWVIVLFLSAWLTQRQAWSTLANIQFKSLFFIILSALATGASWLAYVKALQYGKVTQVAPIDKLSVVWAMVLAIFLLQERPHIHEYLGMLFIVAGVLILSIKVN